MANPTFASDGGGSKVDSLVDLAATVGLHRGYAKESPTGATSPSMHVGVMAVPATITAVASTVSPAIVTATLPTVSVGTNYLDGFHISGTGSNTGGIVHATISGLASRPMDVVIAVPSGPTNAMTPLFVTFPNPIAGSAPSTAITLTVPSFGTGNVGVSVALWGHSST